MKQVLLSAFAFVVLGNQLLAEDVIIESRAEGKNNAMYSEPVGGWLSSNTPADTAKSSAPDLTAQGTAGSRKLTPKPEAPAGSIVGSARFAPKLSTPGNFNVYATWPKSANSTPIHYVIKHAKGEEVKTVSQDGWGALGAPNGNRWISLGEFEFLGEGGYVELQVPAESGASSPSTAQQTSSDAVRFSSTPIPDAMVPKPAEAPAEVVFQSTTPAMAPIVDGPPAALNTPPALPVPVQDTGPIEWVTTLQAGRTKARSESKKLLLFFYIEGNPRSDIVEKTYLGNANVKGVIKTRYVPVKINMTTEKAFAEQVQVYRAGTILLFDGTQGIDQITDINSAEVLASRLATH